MPRRSYQFSAEGPWRFPSRRPQLPMGLSLRDLLARIDLRMGTDLLVIGETPHLCALQQEVGTYGRLFRSKKETDFHPTCFSEDDASSHTPTTFDRIVVFDLQDSFSQGQDLFALLRKQLKPTGRLILLSAPQQPPLQRSPWIRQAQRHGFVPCLRFGATWSDTLLLQPHTSASSLRKS